MTFGVGCGDGFVPGRESPGLGSGGSKTVHFPAGPQSVFAHQPEGAESLAQMTPKPGDLPKVTAPRVPPGWAAARLRLWRAFALHQDLRGDACGHLEEGRRLAANSDWAGEGWGGGWVLGGGGWRYLPWKPRTAPAWPVSATTARTSGRGEGRGRGADQAERSQVPAGSSASVSRSEAGVGVGESGMSEGLRFWLRDPGRERGGVRQAVRGPGQGIVGVGCLGWGGGAPGAEGGGQSGGTTPQRDPIE